MRFARWALPLCLACNTTPDEEDTEVDTTDTVPVDTTDTEDTPVVDTDPDDTEVDTPDPDPVDPCLASPTVIEIGTGETAYQPLTPGQDLEMVYGPQGGWHLTTAFHASNVLDTVVLRTMVTDVETGIVVSETQLNALLVSPAPVWSCVGTHYNHNAVLEITEAIDGITGTPAEVLCGRDVEIRTSVSVHPLVDHPAAGEELGVGTVVVRAQPDPVADGPACE